MAVRVVCWNTWCCSSIREINLIGQQESKRAVSISLCWHFLIFFQLKLIFNFKVSVSHFPQNSRLRASESVVDGFEWFICPWLSPSIRLPSIQNGGAYNTTKNSGRSPRLSDLVLHDLCEQDSPDISVTTVIWRPQFVPWQGSVYLFSLQISPGALPTCYQELTGGSFAGNQEARECS